MACCLAAAASAQKVQARPPIGAKLVETGAPAKGSETDEGTAVELFESPNLDRHLRRAQDCLAREDWPQAIKILQDVIEGRTLEAVDTSKSDGAGGGATAEGAPSSSEAASAPTESARKDPAKNEPAKNEPTKKEAEKPAEKPAAKEGPQATAKARVRAMRASADGEDASPPPRKLQEIDPAHSVFSANGRIYRPVRRLCQELLAGLPKSALDLYRTQYDAAAQEALAEAERAGASNAFETVVDRYFATLAAGRAMQALADRFMQEGRYRNAVQVLRDLSGLYPKSNLQELGVSPVWCRFKIALCLRLADETAAAGDEARAIAQAFPDESLRVMGELQPLKSLPDSALFARGDQTLVGPAARPDRQAELIASGQQLVPLWQYRCKSDPYAPPTPSKDNDRNVFFNGQGAAMVAPPAAQYGTGTSMAFFGGSGSAGRALFLEGNRLRVADALSGVLLQEGDKSDEAPRQQEGRPRARVPVYDFALQRPQEDDARWYAIAGSPKNTQSTEPLRFNELLAYDKRSGARVWSTQDFLEGDDGFKEVTFLAAPVVFGERLLAPVLRSGAYALQCLDRATGKPLWCSRIHAGGTPYFKAPGTQVQLLGSTAYLLTNAGALAAIDTFAGELRWLRRYERRHPLREMPKAKKSARNEGMGFFGNQFQFSEQELPGFLPSDLIAAGGLLVLAPCDGSVLMCIDGASGEPVWMIDADSRHAPFGRMRSIVGANSRNLYVASETDLVCIGLQSGLMQWTLPMPKPAPQITRWRGRGVVLEQQVIMPGDRELLVVDADNAGRRGWQRVPLPALELGSEPLHGPNNLFVSGPFLGVSYPAGVEVYATDAALRQLAVAEQDPLRKAVLLRQAGDRDAAVAALSSWLDSAQAKQANDAQRESCTNQCIALLREQALAAEPADLAVLDRALPLARSRPTRLMWHLARLDVCQRKGDLRAYEQEQQRLYRFMEGRD